MAKSDHQYLARSFIVTLAWLAILGTIIVVVGNIIGSLVVPGHDMVADTISDLAAGRYEIIQDVALYGFAAALMALALGTAHLHDGKSENTLLTFALTLLAVCVIIIGARNEYGDADNEGIVIHRYIVYLLGAAFAAAFALAALVGGRLAGYLPGLSWACLALWSIGGPAFFLSPTGWDGLIERAVGLVAAAWTVGYALALRRFALRNRDETR